MKCGNCGNPTEVGCHGTYKKFCCRSCDISFRNKRNWANPEYRRKQTEQNRKLAKLNQANPEFCIKRDRQFAEMKQTEAYQQSLSINMTKRLTKLWQSEEFRSKMRPIQSANGKAVAQKNESNPEFKEHRKLRASLQATKQILEKKTNFARYRARRCNYKGINMRSSWEVEFAQLCDEQKITWEYEPKAFKLSDKKQYTPDFYLPETNKWVEIKPLCYHQQAQVKKQLMKKIHNIDLIIVERTKFREVI